MSLYAKLSFWLLAGMLYKRGNLSTRGHVGDGRTQRRDREETQWEGGSLEARQRGLGVRKACWHIYLGFQFFRTVEK